MDNYPIIEFSISTRVLTLTVVTQQKNAIRFYQSFGFHIYGTEQETFMRIPEIENPLALAEGFGRELSRTDENRACDFNRSEYRVKYLTISR